MRDLSKLGKTEITDQEFKRFVSLLSAALCAAMISVGVVNFILAMSDPRVTLEKSGASTPQGQVEGIVVRLIDPSLLDRFMASLPQLPAVFWSIFVFGYLFRSDILKARQVRGMKVSKKVFIFAVPIGIFAFTSPLLASMASASYFDTTVTSGEIPPLIIFCALALVTLDSIAAKTGWNKEYGRAEVLDKKMQDVV